MEKTWNIFIRNLRKENEKLKNIYKITKKIWNIKNLEKKYIQKLGKKMKNEICTKFKKKHEILKFGKEIYTKITAERIKFEMKY